MAEEAAAAAAMMKTVGTTRIPIPIFAEESFRMYMDKIDIWKEVCGIVKAKQGMVLWMHLPRETPSDIKESIMASDRAAWRGPATVLGNRGSVYFFVHQGELVRVAACKIVALENVDKQINVKDKQTNKVLAEVKEKELKEAPGIDLEAGQQKQEQVTED